MHAAAIGLSESHLRRLLTAELGQPLSAFLKRERLALARHYLLTTTLSVKEVMAKVGCRDASHFVRDFAREYGLSPRRYRECVLAAKARVRELANR